MLLLPWKFFLVTFPERGRVAVQCRSGMKKGGADRISRSWTGPNDRIRSGYDGTEQTYYRNGLTIRKSIVSRIVGIRHVVARLARHTTSSEMHTVVHKTCGKCIICMQFYA